MQNAFCPKVLNFSYRWRLLPYTYFHLLGLSKTFKSNYFSSETLLECYLDKRSAFCPTTVDKQITLCPQIVDKLHFDWDLKQ